MKTCGGHENWSTIACTALLNQRLFTNLTQLLYFHDRFPSLSLSVTHTHTHTHTHTSRHLHTGRYLFVPSARTIKYEQNEREWEFQLSNTRQASIRYVQTPRYEHGFKVKFHT